MASLDAVPPEHDRATRHNARNKQSHDLSLPVAEPEHPQHKGKAPKTNKEKVAKDELVPDPAAPHVGGGEEQQS